MKILKTIFVFISAILSTGCFNSSTPTTEDKIEAFYFNVKKYGAKGDGFTDDTQAIQKAINAAAKDGGTVFFPKGIYNISGPIIDSVNGYECMSQLYIPHVAIDNPKNIIFRGEFAPEFEMQAITYMNPSRNGAILYSSLISDNPQHAVIAMQKGPEGDWAQWNYLTPSFKDIGIRTCTMTDSIPIINSLNAINLSLATKCLLDNVLIDTNCPLSVSINPELAKSIGLITPGVNNHALISIGLVRVAGYACGIKFSEHFVGKDVQVVGCHIGMLSESCHHSSSIQTLEIECCNYPIVFDAGHNLFVANYNTEHFTEDKWFKIKQDITFKGEYYYPAKVVIGLCHPVVSYIGYDFNSFSTNDWSRVVLLEKRSTKL